MESISGSLLLCFGIAHKCSLIKTYDVNNTRTEAWIFILRQEEKLSFSCGHAVLKSVPTVGAKIIHLPLVSQIKDNPIASDEKDKLLGIQENHFHFL